MRFRAWISNFPAVLLLVSHVSHVSIAASPPAVEAQHGMVVSAQRLASEVGVEILRRGGNAIDAAVAVGYAQAVVNPCCGNIGGGGFMVLRLANGQERFIDFRETAPAAVTQDMYLDENGEPIPGASVAGYKAVAVPGTVLGLDTALTRYGKLGRTAVMAPAIRLASAGFVLRQGDADIFHFLSDRLGRDPEAAKVFLHPDKTPLMAGERLVQPDLARTLGEIAAHGPRAFYEGRIPEAIGRAAAANGGVITAADFKSYKIDEIDPLHCDYRGYSIISAPPPSSGGTTLCEILNILEGYDLKAAGLHSAKSIHLMVEAMRHAFVDRNYDLGDPAFVTNPLDRLLSKDYAAAIRSHIDPDKATKSADVEPGMAPHEKSETTHYSVMDHDGNAVAVTYTVNGGFGAGVMAPGTGFLLNDEMDDFTVKEGRPNMYGLVQGKKNLIAPGKRPLSSMAPTIVAKDGKTMLILGSPGGSRIITITLETLINIIDFGLAPQEAVDLPRFHHQWQPDEIDLEPLAASPDTANLLQAMGYALKEQRPWGASELIEVAPTGAGPGLGGAGHDSALSGALKPGFLYGANDDRRPSGGAVGY